MALTLTAQQYWKKYILTSILTSNASTVSYRTLLANEIQNSFNDNYLNNIGKYLATIYRGGGALYPITSEFFSNFKENNNATWVDSSTYDIEIPEIDPNPEDYYIPDIDYGNYHIKVFASRLSDIFSDLDKISGIEYPYNYSISQGQLYYSLNYITDSTAIANWYNEHVDYLVNTDMFTPNNYLKMVRLYDDDNDEPVYEGNQPPSFNDYTFGVKLSNSVYASLTNPYTNEGFTSINKDTGFGSSRTFISGKNGDYFNYANALNYVADVPDNYDIVDAAFVVSIRYDGTWYSFYLIDKDTLEDTLDLLVPNKWEYDAPLDEPRIDTLTIKSSTGATLTLTPAFDSETIDYTVETPSRNIRIDALSNAKDDCYFEIYRGPVNKLTTTHDGQLTNYTYSMLSTSGQETIYIKVRDKNSTTVFFTYRITLTLAGPRILTLTFDDPDAIMYPAFDPNFGGPYSITTAKETLQYTWTVNEDARNVYINLVKQTGSTHTFNLGQGNNQGNIYVEGEDDDFEYEIQINQYATGDLMPIITNLNIIPIYTLSSDTVQPLSLKLTPYWSSDIHQYTCYVSNVPDYIELNMTFVHATSGSVNNDDFEVGYNYSYKMTIPQSKRITIMAYNSLTDPTLSNTYIIDFVFKTQEELDEIPPEQYLPISGGSGAISSAQQAVDLSEEYPPGFYGGSYIPNWRYVHTIYTTGNGISDFERAYGDRKSANENAVNLLNVMIAGYIANGRVDAICEAFIHYSNFINDNSGNNDWRYVLPAINVSLSRPTTLTTEHFSPKNRKCFTYPFSSLELNGYGTMSDLAYEDFTHTFNNNQHILEFDIFAKWFAGVSIQLVPVNYKNIEDNFDYAVAGPEMPVFPYTKNEYLNEYNASRNTRSQALEAARQNADIAKQENLLSMVSGVAGAAISGGYALAMGGMNDSPGSALGAVAGGLGAVVQGYTAVRGYQLGKKKIELQLNQLKKSLAAELADIANRPATVTNQNASPSITMVSKDAACPFVIHKALRPEILKKVDKFFTRFGYKTNRTGIPNIYQRPNFDYLECKNAVVGGNIPAEDKQALKEIFEHGITFWHYGSSGFKGVGDYGDADYTYNLAPTR